MEIWTLFLAIAVFFLVLETLIPSLFCINFAFAGIITAFISIFWGSIIQLVWLFLGLSLFSIIFLKPFFHKLRGKFEKQDFESQYVGKIATVIEPVTENSGAVTIFDERWEARLSTCQNKEIQEIPQGESVRIISNESTILYVAKI